MIIKEKKEKHWFTAADALIVVIVLGLLIGSAILFLFPTKEETEAKTVQAAIVVHLEGEIIGIKANDKLFVGETEIGSVQKVDTAANNVVAVIQVEKEDGVYYLDGNPVRVNGAFTLETRLCHATGVVSDIGDKED